MSVVKGRGAGSDGTERGDITYSRSAQMASDTGSSSRLIVRTATAAALSFALLLPANAQFWGNSWGGRQQQPQQPYNPLCAAAVQSCSPARPPLPAPLAVRAARHVRPFFR